MLERFADMPREAEEEIRNLDQARRRIAELERQLKSSNSVRATPSIDQTVIERAARSAIARERLAWQRKLAQGRGRLRQVCTAVSASGQALDKTKALLQGLAEAWPSRPDGDAAPPVSLNGPAVLVHKRTGRSAPAPDPANGAAKLPVGERRILTALAQYPQGRSKVQLAVLTGYAVTGGGFNNYLGALRSQGLIDGDGERLRITADGVEMLGSWEPLPGGGALIDYWQRRLGKAERSILEALTHVYPAALDKAEIAARTGYEASGGGFNNALGRLRTLELVQGRGELKASDNLFDGV